ncbi:MAG TPA: pyridoxamine 5'-phosphate oxidase family protein [Dehalococcoidia bacterium]|jgi:PPOX class probable F420-dependent enzyme|nr:pyridoxamine 5'-phosphate oxidase family protein [Dehalococcoidia bacterium]
MELQPLAEAELKKMLSEPFVAKLATASKSGEIRITPIWFHAEPDGSFLLNTFEDSAPVKNLRRDPKASLLIDSRDWPYYAVHYWGTAEVEGPKDDAEGIAKMFTPYVGSPEGATDYAKTLISYGTRVYIRFRPDRAVSYDFRQ